MAANNKYFVFLIFSALLSGNVFADSCFRDEIGLPENVDQCQSMSLVNEAGIKKVDVIEYEDQTTYLIKELDGKYKKSPPLLGDVVVLKGTHRIILIGISSHYRARHSYVFDYDLNQISQINHDEVSQYGTTDDGKLFWIALARIDKSGQVISDIRVFDYNGLQVDEVRVSESSVINVLYQGHEYEINVPSPEVPG